MIYYYARVDAATMSHNASEISLNVDEIALFVAKCVLREKIVCNLNEFLKEWQSILVELMLVL
jgi:hypothetical protein